MIAFMRQQQSLYDVRLKMRWRREKNPSRISYHSSISFLSSFWSSIEFFFSSDQNYFIFDSFPFGKNEISLFTSFNRIRYGFLLIAFPHNIKFYIHKKICNGKMQSAENAMRSKQSLNFHPYINFLTSYLSLTYIASWFMELQIMLRAMTEKNASLRKIIIFQSDFLLTSFRHHLQYHFQMYRQFWASCTPFGGTVNLQRKLNIRRACFFKLQCPMNDVEKKNMKKNLIWHLGY